MQEKKGRAKNASGTEVAGKSVAWKLYIQPAFLICVIVLAVSGGGMSIAIKTLGVQLQKQPLPLKKPLELLDEKALTSYNVLAKTKIENKDIVKALGTEEYIQWVLEDTSVPDDSPVRRCGLFITYYDLPDKVPHVPEECYAGGGHQRLATDAMTCLITNQTDASEIDKESVEEEIPIRRLVFARTSPDLFEREARFSVFYLIKVNGIYANNRDDARAALYKNLLKKHSYFSKVEWWFLSKSGFRTCPTKEESLAASQKLLATILPILEKEHWPVW